MVERERGAGRPVDDERTEQGAIDAAHVSNADTTDGAAAAEEARHQRVMASAARVSRKHRNVLAALAK